MHILLIGGCGYIGSVTYEALTEYGHDVDIIDIAKRGNPGRLPYRSLDYGLLTEADIAPYEAVVLLAAHSSVREAIADPQGAFSNNVASFYNLLNIIDGRRLVYASSSSIYSGLGDKLASETSSWFAMGNMYDFSKFVDDGLAKMSGQDCYGLRFGTVNGPSPNLREDLMINRMVLTALNDKCLNVSNPHVHRPILALKDLTRAILAVLDGPVGPGVYNVANFNATVFEIALQVSKLLDTPIRFLDNNPTYDFMIDTSKFEIQYDFTFNETLESVVADLHAYLVQNFRLQEVTTK